MAEEETTAARAVARYTLIKRDEAGNIIETLEGADDSYYILRTWPDGRQERIRVEQWLSQTPAPRS